jgi:hypothetical protein
VRVTSEAILKQLPPYNDKWELINPYQYVPDIINEVCHAQTEFGAYYDMFSYMFLVGNAEDIAECLYQFCKRNIRYKEETVQRQTTALPTGILTRGYGDCKHYALICAGVIASLNRMYGACIDWCFCFAGYGGATEPYHVFVSVNYRGEELWLDPTPGSGGNPSVLIRRQVYG